MKILGLPPVRFGNQAKQPITNKPEDAERLKEYMKSKPEGAKPVFNNKGVLIGVNYDDVDGVSLGR